MGSVTPVQKAEELQQEGEELLQEKFNQAVAKVNTAKKEFPSLKSVQNAPKRFNPYQGMSTLERLMFGFNLQYNRKKPWSIDYALNIAYPLKKHMRIGVGKSFKISKGLHMSTIMFYDFFCNENTSPYSQAFVFRVGMEL